MKLTVLAPQAKVYSDIVSSRDVSEEKVLDFRDVHRLLDGSVTTTDLKEAALHCVLTDHHSEKHSHLVIPGTQGPHRHINWSNSANKCCS